MIVTFSIFKEPPYLDIGASDERDQAVIDEEGKFIDRFSVKVIFHADRHNAI
jgi:hypothetical protein